MIAAALLALFTLLASWFDQPAPEPLPAPAVVEVPAPVVTQGARPTTPHHAPPADVEPTCATPGEEWQGEFGCVAVQRPEEALGGDRMP